MPFIVTTTRSCTCQPSECEESDGLLYHEIGCHALNVPRSERATRRAVATLEEAGEAYHEALFVCGIEPPTEVWDRWAMEWYEHVSESGGSVGPLPDGTRIDVEPTTFDWLMEQVPDAFDGESPELAADIIAAYNARQSHDA